jgi:outer membrane protease
MKNIAVFAAFVIIGAGLVFCPPAGAQGHVLSNTVPGESRAPFPYALSLSPSAGFLYGHGEEPVYKYPGEETYLSQLLWDIKPLWYLGTALDFSPIRPLEKWGFFTGLSLKFGFPGRTGIMEDRDWETQYDELTKYSRSDSYTNGAFLLDVSLGLSLPVKKLAVFKFYWTFSWMSFQWTARDGYKWYSPNANTPLDDSVEPAPLYGASVVYLQNWILTSPGLALSIPLFRHFRVDLKFQMSPFVFCGARDDHVLRDLEIIDNVLWGLYLEPAGTFAFAFLDRFELSLSVSYRYIRGRRGDSYDRKTGESGGIYLKHDQAAGAAWYALDSGLIFKVRL